MAPAATGTDTGGSIREPAAFSGVTGIKPTYGRSSRWGMIAFASSLDQAGPIAPSAEDAALILNAMLGFDPKDSTSVDRPAEDYTRDLATRRSRACASACRRSSSAKACSRTCERPSKPLARIRRSWARHWSTFSLPNAALAVPVYYVHRAGGSSSNLSRFDGVRYGHRAAQYGDLIDMTEEARRRASEPNRSGAS